MLCLFFFLPGACRVKTIKIAKDHDHMIPLQDKEALVGWQPTLLANAKCTMQTYTDSLMCGLTPFDVYTSHPTRQNANALSVFRVLSIAKSNTLIKQIMAFRRRKRLSN